MVSYYVCGAFMYTIYISYMYVLGYNSCVRLEDKLHSN